TLFRLEVGNDVRAEAPPRVFPLRIGGRPGLEDRHDLIGSHALVVFHHLNALIRGTDAEATGGEDLLGADALAHLGIPLHTTHVVAIAVRHVLGVYPSPTALVVAQADVDIPGSNLCTPLSGPLLVLVAKADARDHDLVVDELAHGLRGLQRLFVDIDAARHSVVLAEHVAQAANPQFPGALEGVILATR